MNLPATTEERAPFLPSFEGFDFNPQDISQVRADAKSGARFTGQQTRDRNSVLYRAIVALRATEMMEADIARTLGCSRNTVRAVCLHEDACSVIEQGKGAVSKKLLVSGYRVLQAALAAAHTSSPKDQAIIGSIALDRSCQLAALGMGEGAEGAGTKGESIADIRARVQAALAAAAGLVELPPDSQSGANVVQSVCAVEFAASDKAVVSTFDAGARPIQPPQPPASVMTEGDGGGGVGGVDGAGNRYAKQSENLNCKWASVSVQTSDEAAPPSSPTSPVSSLPESSCEKSAPFTEPLTLPQKNAAPDHQP
jgi:hypothetical protein